MTRRRRKFFDKGYVRHEKRRNTILACILLWSVLSTFAIKHWGFGGVEVEGTSMTPTLFPGERYVVHRWIYYYRSPQRGEIVVILNRDGTESVKRVIGLPGEKVEITGGAVRLNGQPLLEPYIPQGVRTYPEGGHHPSSWDLGDRQFFVLGDNRLDSEDSRYFGPLSGKHVLGKIRNPKPAPKKLSP